MIFSQTQVSFTKAEIVALLAFASADITRPAMCGIQFNANIKRAAAVDGHGIAWCDGEGDAGTWTYLAPRGALETAARVKGAATFILSPATRDIGVHGKDASKLATIDAPEIEGTFPPIDQVVGAPARSHSRQGVNSAQLPGIVLVATAAGNPHVRLYPGESELDPIQVRVGAWGVLLMPCRFSDTEKIADKATVAAHKPRKSTAIVLASAPSMPAEPSGAAIVVNAASLGSDALQALPQASKSRSRVWRETYASTADHVDPVTLRAWVEDADAPPLPSVDTARPPWG